MSNTSAELKQAVEIMEDARPFRGEDQIHLCRRGQLPHEDRETIELVPVLVVIGVREDGTKLVLGLQGGDKESAPVWRQFFKDLKERGLDAHTVALGIMDGLSGLEKVFEEEFSHAKVQRCQVHVAKNVIAKAPRT